jgi:hypothetical protein
VRQSAQIVVERKRVLGGSAVGEFHPRAPRQNVVRNADSIILPPYLVRA